MAIQVIDMYDTTTGSVSSLPPGQQVAGYTTGSGIAWSQAQFDAHTTPHHAVRIDQDSGARDPSADILDVERGAATIAEIPRWITLARASFNSAARPGQRWPGVYCSLSDLDNAVNALKVAGLSNVPFGIPELTNRVDAINKVTSAAGPYPRVWQQYRFGNLFDSGIVSVPWLTKVSGTVTPPKFATVSVGPYVVAVLTEGMSDAELTRHDVTRAQAALVHVYGATIAVDGSYGPASVAAVKTLQSVLKLTVDGIVGHDTWDALNHGQ